MFNLVRNMSNYLSMASDTNRKGRIDTGHQVKLYMNASIAAKLSQDHYNGYIIIDQLFPVRLLSCKETSINSKTMINDRLPWT